MVKLNWKSVSISSLGVSEGTHSDFYTSSWQRGESPVPMLVARILLNVVALAIFLWTIIEANSLYVLIYLTNWGVLLILLTTVSGLAVSCMALCRRPNESKELPWHVSLYWVVFNISLTISVMITALYWILLYNPVQREEMGPLLFMLDVTKHGITSCVVMAELLISRTPVKLVHIYQPFGVAVIYSIFTGIYYVAGGTDSKGNTYIYSVLDWQIPQKTSLIILGSFAGLIILYLVLWAIALARDKISTALVRSQGQATAEINQVKLQDV